MRERVSRGERESVSEREKVILSKSESEKV